ncbi:spirocyclase AveC family protein [Mycobacterium branderi]|uniref:DUF5135 domain-containing protein n=1 Tax=Mycobacterium branderi TaxID=43348 RepID=A0A7I7WD78_9MYCO|nr:spirocyclase AveC family protein [Mycobacterium branderi]MCV7231858.1 spirocyclase AveC family protein [Mycobacterium branderi]ORA40198.1 hypothetical protein BST20_06410 [Mycobacterium branderi]BBZ15486.1 DUF5135 domain-containing protein [Mycobacterium branderi]
MATRFSSTASTPAPASAQALPDSRLRPLHYWSALGAIFAAVQIYVYVSWIVSGDAYRQPTGADPVPSAVKAAAWIMQAVCLLAAVCLVIYLWRRSRREGKLAWDTLVAIAFAGAYWMDPVLNFARPTFFYNSYLINFGSWTSHIPGWLSPNAGNLPEPILMIGPLYAWLFVLFGILFCAMARRLHRIRPNIGKVGIFLTGVVVFGIFDLVMEGIFVQTRLFAYPGVIGTLSMFPGQVYQFPIYEAFIGGINASVVGMIRLTRDDHGHSVIERGAEGLQVGARVKTTLRILAFIGLANTMWVVMNIVYVGNSFYIDNVPHYPSYLNNDICGVRVAVPCPGPGVPILIDNTPHRLNPR